MSDGRKEAGQPNGSQDRSDAEKAALKKVNPRTSHLTVCPTKARAIHDVIGVKLDKNNAGELSLEVVM